MAGKVCWSLTIVFYPKNALGTRTMASTSTCSTVTHKRAFKQLETLRSHVYELIYVKLLLQLLNKPRFLNPNYTYQKNKINRQPAT